MKRLAFLAAAFVLVASKSPGMAEYVGQYGIYVEQKAVSCGQQCTLRFHPKSAVRKRLIIRRLTCQLRTSGDFISVSAMVGSSLVHLTPMLTSEYTPWKHYLLNNEILAPVGPDQDILVDVSGHTPSASCTVHGTYSEN